MPANSWARSSSVSSGSLRRTNRISRGPTASAGSSSPGRRPAAGDGYRSLQGGLTQWPGLATIRTCVPSPLCSDRIHSSAEEIVSALKRAADSLGGDDLTQVLITAISHRGQIDATINSIVGGFDDVTDEEQPHRRRHLDITEGPNGGYVLTGYVDPKGGAMVRGALDAVIEPEDTNREAARREPVSSRQPPAWPFSSPASATVEPPAKARKVRRNHPCPCRSGRKHKNCCGV